MTLIAIPWVASPLPTSSVKLLTQQPYGRGRVDDVLLVGQFQLSESLNLVNVHDSLDPRHHRQVHLADFALGKHHHAAMVRRGREGGLQFHGLHRGHVEEGRERPQVVGQLRQQYSKPRFRVPEDGLAVPLDVFCSIISSAHHGNMIIHPGPRRKSVNSKTTLT